jgi:hypothetical protein
MKKVEDWQDADPLPAFLAPKGLNQMLDYVFYDSQSGLGHARNFR